MIRLERVSKVNASARRRPARVLSEVSLSIPTDRHVAILGKSLSGKTTLLRLFLGYTRPDRGSVISDARLSPPLGFSQSLHAEMTGLENIMFVARLYGEPWQDLATTIDAVTGLGRVLEERVLSYQPAQKAALAYALILGIHFDCYLADDKVAPRGNKRKLGKSLEELLEERLRTSGLILCTNNAAQARKYCDVALVLSEGALVAFDDIDEAIRYYEMDR